MGRTRAVRRAAITVAVSVACLFGMAQVVQAQVPPQPCVAGAEMFDDVAAASPFCAWIEELAERAITAGCSASSYCPNGSVTRAQMAVFLLKTLEGGSYEPPPCTPGAELFDDVAATSPFCGWIEELAARSVTAGCTATSYCPNNSVTRAQMAVFLLRTFPLVA